MPLSYSQQRRETLTLAAAVAVATVFVATTALSWYRRRRRKNQEAANNDSNDDETKADPTPAPPINSINKSKVDPTVWRSFEEAAHRIRTDKTLHLKNGDKLMFYGLFKHIVSGDAPAKMSMHRNTFNIVVEQAKHASWAKMRGIPVSMAITHYLAAVQHFAKTTTTTIDEDASENSSSTTTDGDLTGGAMGPGVVSRPAVDNGGIAEEDDQDSSDQPPEVRLLQAAGKNELDALIHLLKEAAAAATTTATQQSAKVDMVNYQDESGQTALHLAADKGSVECCIALLEAGANVNAADHDGISVLQAAVIAGNIRICKVLLDHGADADQADQDGDTPRSCAMEDGDEVLKRVFSQSAIPTIQEDTEDES